MARQKEQPMTIVMIGSTGAVGSETVRALTTAACLANLTLLGRRTLDGVADDRVDQQIVDVLEPQTYQSILQGHDCAICTFGVGQPSKVSKEEFLRIDKQAVLDFATACKAAGVDHFQLLSSVGADSQSRSFYLRSKGELQDALQALEFDRLSLFQPSMILTENNRYGILQAVTLAVWPLLGFFLVGPLSKYRGVRVEKLGHAIAKNARISGSGVEILQWRDFMQLQK